MKARASACALSKAHGQVFLAIARSERLATIVCLIGAVCVSSSTYAEGQRLWSRGFSSEPANSIDRAREFVLFSVDQGELNLVGTWSYTNGAVGNEPPPRVVIEGTKAADGSFWPDVSLEVRKGRTGKWERIATSPNLGERATVTIEPNAINFDLMVNLDPFKPLLDKYKSGRIVLNTGRTSEFEMKDLSPPERERESTADSAERRQIPSTSGPESWAQANLEEKALVHHGFDAPNLITNRILALLRSPSQPRVGSSINDFLLAWDTPVRKEVLDRTARLVWQPAPQSNAALPTGIFNVEVSFLDGTACEIVLRSKKRLTSRKLAELAKPLLGGFRDVDFAKPKSDLNGFRIYKVSGGSVVSVNKHKRHNVIGIMDQCYLRNQDIFDGEAAKVRPPTSNH